MITRQYYWRTIFKDVCTYIKDECENLKCKQRYIKSTFSVDSFSSVVATQNDHDDHVENLMAKTHEDVAEIEHLLSGYKSNKKDDLFLDVIIIKNESHRGYKHIYVLTDTSNNVMEVKPIREHNTEQVGLFLKHYFCNYGLVNNILIVESEEFCIRLAQYMKQCLPVQLFHSYQVIKCSTDDYLNRKFCKAVGKFIEDRNCYDWDRDVPLMVYIYKFPQNIETDTDFYHDVKMSYDQHILDENEESLYRQFTHFIKRSPT